MRPYNNDVPPTEPPTEPPPEAPLIRHTDEMAWEPSPSATVLRKRLELIGPAEAGRVTSVVRYLPDSSFHPHPHPDGEEILVLEGVFTDHTGDHPAGSYLLNPEGFEHAPSSRGGCVLFVKLRQYAGAGRETVRIGTASAAWSPHSSIAGVDVLELYRSERYPEQMRLVRMAAGAQVPRQEFPRGEEIFVVEGAFRDEHGAYRAGSWVRYPPGSGHTPRSERGCTLYVKKDHL
jgi:anti-sigma factor ChrR (cupin superfamily)